MSAHHTDFKPLPRHAHSNRSRGSNPKSSGYKARRDQEINENIARLEKQGIVFHYDRNPSHRRLMNSARDRYLASNPYSAARVKKTIPTRTYLRFSFMLCCLSIIFYYVLVYIF